MDHLILTLADGTSYHVDRNRITAHFSDSILGSALQLDPTTNQIAISSSDVSPSVLKFLSQLNTSDEKLPPLPSPEELQRAYRYLGGVTLAMLSHPHINDVQLNIFNPRYHTAVLYKLL